MTANNHGSLEFVNGQWYIFYHCQTHSFTYSRQSCAEKVTIGPDGSIAQAERTSCGLNDGPLVTKGTYPAPICCNLSNGRMPHATNRFVGADIPFMTHSGDGENAERYNIACGHFLMGIETMRKKQSQKLPEGRRFLILGNGGLLLIAFF